MPRERHINTDPKFVKWEDELTCIIESEGLTRSDAQGVVEGQPKAVKRAWEKGLTPSAAAEAVLRAATPDQGPSQ